jgi:hypothetical protein
MKIAKGDDHEPLDMQFPSEYPVVFKWSAQSSLAKHVYLTVFALICYAKNVRNCRAHGIAGNARSHW